MWLHNCVTTFATIAVTSSCHDIMCELIPGSLFLFFGRARGEPGNEAGSHMSKVYISHCCHNMIYIM